jgi:uncharacterized membrane protein HdeD (DUF308 family)
MEAVMVLLARNWWAFVLRGLFAILFGLLTFFMPHMALITLIYIFGLYALADGIFDLVAAFSSTGGAAGQRWWALLIEGLLSIAAGVLAFVLPGLTAVVLLYLIAAWAILTGVLEISAAIRLRKQITGEWLLALAGVASILFGALLFIHPGVGALAVVLWIGAYALFFGVLMVALGLRLRSWARHGMPETHDFRGGIAPSH